MILDPLEGLESLSPIPWMPGGARAMLRKPAWRKALNDAIVVTDDYSIGRLVKG